MDDFQKIKADYENGIYGEMAVHNAVVKGWITKDEYRMIIGRNYED